MTIGGEYLLYHSPDIGCGRTVTPGRPFPAGHQAAISSSPAAAGVSPRSTT